MENSAEEMTVKYVCAVCEFLVEAIRCQHEHTVTTQLGDRLAEFYRSLFTQRDGILPVQQIRPDLQAGVPANGNRRSGTTTTQNTAATTTTTATDNPTAPKRRRVRTGRGGPGIARKCVVTERQKHRRRQKGMANAPPPAPSPPTLPPTPPPTQPQTLPPPPPPRAQTPPPTGEPSRKTPRAQVLDEFNKKKRIENFKELAGVTDKEGYDPHELVLWKKDLRGWQLLEESFEEPLRDKWRALRSMPKIASDPRLIDAFFEFASLANGFANQAAHMTGYLVQEVLQVGDQNGFAPEQVLDDLVALLDAKSYAMYCRHLEECKCGACEAILQYDDDCGQGEVKGRPSHCVRVEPWAQMVRKFSRGLSGTTLRNCEYFFASTPKMSPPMLSLATSTDVQACTRRYMKWYLQGLQRITRTTRSSGSDALHLSIYVPRWPRCPAILSQCWMVTLTIWS
ncbi:Hypothetical predicted protein [Paramuricea clavata]|uniref:Uncharacterized protein n=1 Tax=Paramuricea clavata TaxID=317549 RepID=A0A6S7HIF4_PARCT|nr:Hypothetical predicted protein [Paramuricea clavata]